LLQWKVLSKVSAVESTYARTRLAVAERAAAAPYVDYPPTPWWYAPVIGAWTAAVLGTFVWWRENAGLFIAALLVLIALELLFVSWMKRRHGALPVPGRGRPPAEIAAVWRGYMLGVAAIALLVALAWVLGGTLIAAGSAFVLVTAGLIGYERRYAVAAAQVRSRLT
jgi:hypothetical protein